MTDDKLTFSDLFEEIKIKIFKYFSLNEKIKYASVSREWSAILSRLKTLQDTLVIGEPTFDLATRMKLSLCNIYSLHVATSFNTVGTKDLLSKYTKDEAADVISRLLKSFKQLKSIFIYDPVKIKLSDLSDTIEHIHFGHNTENVIIFDKLDFVHLTCISTIDAHLDQSYLDGLTTLLQAQKSHLENVSICEVSRSLCEQIIEMRNLKQLYVFDFKSDFDTLYNERKLEIIDAHPKLQYFNMFVDVGERHAVCPTDCIEWLIELGSTTGPLDKTFVIDAFSARTFEDTLEFAKDFIHGLYLILNDVNDTDQYQTKLNALRHLRVSYNFPISGDDLQSSIKLIFNIAPNIQKLHLNFVHPGIFEGKENEDIILKEVYAFAVKNTNTSIVFKLSASGLRKDLHFIDKCVPKNLRVFVTSI